MPYYPDHPIMGTPCSIFSNKDTQLFTTTTQYENTQMQPSQWIVSFYPCMVRFFFFKKTIESGGYIKFWAAHPVIPHVGVPPLGVGILMQCDATQKKDNVNL